MQIKLTQDASLKYQPGQLSLQHTTSGQQIVFDSVNQGIMALKQATGLSSWHLALTLYRGGITPTALQDIVLNCIDN